MWLRTLLLLLLAAPPGCREQPLPGAENIRVRVGMVALDTRNLPVVVLEEEEGPRWMPIWIGTAEARSIASQIEDRRSPRPNTHDLARRVIQGLHAEVVRVVVTDLRGGTYYALLSLRLDGETIEIDSRPSDAIAIALRAGAPIFVREEIFESAGKDFEVEESERPIGGPDPQPIGTSRATAPVSL